MSDVPPGHSDFIAVQWIGSLGGWHGLGKPEGGVHPEWTTRFGQYCEPFPNHQADLESPVDEALLARWREVLPEAKRAVLESASTTARTRGELLRTLHGAK